MRGAGSLFRRPGRRVFMCAYMGPRRGKWVRIFRSTGCTTRKAAQAYLDKRVREAKAWRDGEVPEKPDLRKVTMKDLLDDLRIHYSGSKSEEQSRFRLDALEKEFGAVLVEAMTPRRIRDWRDQLRTSGSAPATVNRWVEILRRAFSLAVEDGRLQTAPRFPSKLKEADPRSGFLEPEQVDKLVSHLDPVEGLAVRFLFASGWRKSEATGLLWASVLKDEIRIPTSKNGQGRSIPLAGDLVNILGQLRLKRGSSRFVFHHDGRPLHRNTLGVAFRKAAVSAALGEFDEAGHYSGVLIHDLRRSAARRLRKAGISETVIMKLCGWKTSSMFRRYSVVDSSDMVDALEKIALRPTPRQKSSAPTAGKFQRRQR